MTIGGTIITRAQKDKTVKVQLDGRHDGRFSLTVKLVAWPLNDLRAWAAALLLSPMGRRSGEAVYEALREEGD